MFAVGVLQRFLKKVFQLFFLAGVLLDRESVLAEVVFRGVFGVKVEERLDIVRLPDAPDVCVVEGNLQAAVFFL